MPKTGWHWLTSVLSSKLMCMTRYLSGYCQTVDDATFGGILSLPASTNLIGKVVLHFLGLWRMACNPCCSDLKSHQTSFAFSSNETTSSSWLRLIPSGHHWPVLASGQLSPDRAERVAWRRRKITPKHERLGAHVSFCWLPSSCWH